MAQYPPFPIWWQIYNLYRARPSVDTAATNLSVDFVDVCAAAASWTRQLSPSPHQSWPDGFAPGGRCRCTGRWRNFTLIERQIHRDAVDAGTRTKASLPLLRSLGSGSDGLVVVVDDDGTGTFRCRTSAMSRTTKFGPSLSVPEPRLGLVS